MYRPMTEHEINAKWRYHIRRKLREAQAEIERLKTAPCQCSKSTDDDLEVTAREVALQYKHPKLEKRLDTMESCLTAALATITKNKSGHDSALGNVVRGINERFEKIEASEKPDRRTEERRKERCVYGPDRRVGGYRRTACRDRRAS